MLNRLVNRLGSDKMILIAVCLFILVVGFIYFIKKKNSNPVKKALSKDKLDGKLVYDYGKKILERSIKLDGAEKMEISIGPKRLTDNHMFTRDGSNFKFTVSAVKTRDGDDIINIACHPPGVLKYKGKVKSEINLYNRWEITMNNIPIRYETGQDPTHSTNQLKKGVEK